MKTNDITIVTCSMNRTENLLISLDSLKELNNIDKHLILDFNSDNEIKIDNELIEIFRVDNEENYWASRAYNALFNMVSSEYILKIDADVILNVDEFKKLEYKNYDLIIFDKNKNDPGNFLVKKNLVEKINGFNEYIWTWGYEDHDLVNRLQALNINVLTTNDLIEKIEHSDSLRARSTVNSNIFKDESLFYYSLKKAHNDSNSYLSNKGVWSKNNKLKYKIEKNKILIEHLYDIRSLNLNIKLKYKYLILKYFYKIYKKNTTVVKRVLPVILFIFPTQLISSMLSINIFIKKRK